MSRTAWLEDDQGTSAEGPLITVTDPRLGSVTIPAASGGTVALRLGDERAEALSLQWSLTAAKSVRTYL